MEKSRLKRSYYSSSQDYENDAVGGRTKPRYNNNHSNGSNYNRYPRNPNPSGGYSSAGGGRGGYRNSSYRAGGKGGGGGGSSGPGQEPATVTTSYRILCQDAKVGAVMGKSGSFVKQIRQHTGAWVNVHELVSGDEERIIEVSDSRRRDPEGRMPTYSPAEAALLMIHDRILTSEPLPGEGNVEEGEYRGGGGYNVGNDGVSNRVATRLVVSRMHVGCLLGKGGKIVEQMRVETKTQIRVLSRDHTLPRCISASEEIVQIVGEVNNVKSAVEIIAARLKESQHRDRNNFHGRSHSPERSFPNDDYVPHMNNAAHRSSGDGSVSVSDYRNKSNSLRQSGYLAEAGPPPMVDGSEAYCAEDIVFRMLCPISRVQRVVGESDGIVELLQKEIGVDVRVAEPVSGSDEQIIIISSKEGPDDELFPAQEALLHIQTRIVDLAPDQDNVIKTRLLVQSSEIVCLEGRDGFLFDMERNTGAKIQIVTKDKLPPCVSATDELLQIEGEIKAARDALVEVTSRLRSYIYKDLFQRDTRSATAMPGPVASVSGQEAASPVNVPTGRDGQIDMDPPVSTYQNLDTPATSHQSKNAVAHSTETMKQSALDVVKKSNGDRHEDLPATVNRIAVPLVTRSILEVVIPEQAVPILITKSKNKLAQISKLSGASVTLVEDRPDVTEKIIQLSGTPEEAERAKSLLQGFILSTLEDGP